jgi:hypothetical protein
MTEILQRLETYEVKSKVTEEMLHAFYGPLRLSDASEDFNLSR